jgi:hypothetical protein
MSDTITADLTTNVVTSRDSRALDAGTRIQCVTLDGSSVLQSYVNEIGTIVSHTAGHAPLVQFPIKQLEPGAKIRGKTVAELGNRNRPLDMIVYKKDGKDYVLMANSSRGVMKIDANAIAGADEIAEPVKEERKGVGYETLKDWTGIEHLDKLDDGNALVLRRGEDKSATLESKPLP